MPSNISNFDVIFHFVAILLVTFVLPCCKRPVYQSCGHPLAVRICPFDICDILKSCQTHADNDGVAGSFWNAKKSGWCPILPFLAVPAVMLRHCSVWKAILVRFTHQLVFVSYFQQLVWFRTTELVGFSRLGPDQTYFMIITDQPSYIRVISDLIAIVSRRLGLQ